jgi:hypothetical protein
MQEFYSDQILKAGAYIPFSFVPGLKAGATNISFLRNFYINFTIRTYLMVKTADRADSI